MHARSFPIARWRVTRTLPSVIVISSPTWRAERERMIVLLTFYAERSARQVGDEMTMTEGNVRVTRHRAIGKLRACMTATGGVQ